MKKRQPRWTNIMGSLFLFDIEPINEAVVDNRTSDWSQREQALDIRQSCIVEAPAGSGKTGLLIQRFLKLLADEHTADPEQVLAITFTVKATAELRERILAQLDAAAGNDPVSNPFDEHTRSLAAAVLHRDRLLNWNLLEQPQRLRIRTIDSVCAEIARSLPVLSGSGGQLNPLLDAGLLYKEAARRAFRQLGSGETALHEALRTILLHRDGNLAECERLLADMLHWRDQWGELIPLTGPALTDEQLDAQVLPRLERALDQAICDGLQQLARTIPADVLHDLAELAGELGKAAGHKGEPSPIALCAALHTAPGETAEHLAHWRALIHILTTKELTWRKSFRNDHLGFEFDKELHQPRLASILDELRHRDDLLLAMKRAKLLPPANYPQEQWIVARALFRILSRALIELQLVFSERGECDFAELGLLARTALRRDAHGHDLAAALGMRLQHLLVDEMQDTSSSQYELIEQLTHGWDGRSQTVFLVGDPKQSIYLFRQARVERFVRIMRAGRLGELPVVALRLSANFRSQQRLVEQVNDDFSLLFPREPSSAHPEDVPFVAASPVRESTQTEGMVWHTAIRPPGLSTSAASRGRQRQAHEDAQEVRRIAAEWRSRPLPTGRTKPWSIGVLVRSRNHLADIVIALKQDDGSGSVPFRAIDIELLSERQEVLDLFALTRALLHPADRVAWLAILRAPWCGLSLVDLHLLSGADDPAWAETTVEELVTLRGDLLSLDACKRLERLWTVMQAAARQRSRLSTAQWVERSWRSLGGDAYLGPGETANARRYLQLLDELEAEAGLVNISHLEERLNRLYAEAVIRPGAVDLMTIHGSKGLEWDVVIVPALERSGQTTRGRLLAWLELDSRDAESAPVILAPIAGKGGASRELNKWISSIEAGREAAERKRLFYVACTRAREELHLFASVGMTTKGPLSAGRDSLLKAAWPAAECHFINEPHPSIVVPIRPAADLEQETFAIAAGGEAGSQSPPLLHRLPVSFDYASRFRGSARPNDAAVEPGSAIHRLEPLFERPEGSFAARAFGKAVHTFLELLAQRIAEGVAVELLAIELPQWSARIATVLRSTGLPPTMVGRLTQRVQLALANTLNDATGRWILAPHPEAASERALTTWNEQRSSIRLDRSFMGGPHPLSVGDEVLWIVDFKTATHGREGAAEFLQKERDTYASQMDAYARVLHAHASLNRKICVMLYYPLLPGYTWWSYEPR